jgi:hypothetical protein
MKNEKISVSREEWERMREFKKVPIMEKYLQYQEIYQVLNDQIQNL